MSEFQRRLAAHVQETRESPENESQLPDEIFQHVENMDDFSHFLSFVYNNRKHEKYFEFDYQDIEHFMKTLLRVSEDKEISKYLNSIGVKSNLGRVCYLTLISLGGV